MTQEHPATSSDRPRDLADLLQRVANGEWSVAEALRAWGASPAAAANDGTRPASVQIDHDRERRCGFPEVVFGASKSREDIVEAARRVADEHDRVLVTRVPAQFETDLQTALPDGDWHERARCFAVDRRQPQPQRQGLIGLLCAGTSDATIAEEARVTAEMMGSRVECHYDVGVAGLHRLLALRDRLDQFRVAIVVAGMEGALPSVVGGLVPYPVIAVPTSVGYGASFGGIAALLGMLNSCASGVGVVNIDNGFGAAVLASRINLMMPASD